MSSQTITRRYHAAPLGHPGKMLEQQPPVAIGGTGVEHAHVTIMEHLTRAIDGWRRWRNYRKTCAALAALDAHTLRDIGIDPGDVDTAARGVAGIDGLYRR